MLIGRCEDKGSVVREALRARVLYTGIRRCEDKGFVVGEKLRASPRQRDYAHACG